MSNKIIFTLIGIVILIVVVSLILFRKNNSPGQIASVSTDTSVVKIAIGLLTGQMTLSPTCPVERIPKDPACESKPFSTLIDVFSLSNSKFSIQVHTGQDGTFYVPLPAGMYRISPYVQALYPICPSIEVAVLENSTTTLNISCDTGIR